MAGPWTFGWTQLLTIIGMLLTAAVALGGFRSFERWKREKLEERRMEVAVDALAIAYEARFIFAQIRSVMTYDYEWKDMPNSIAAGEQERRQRAPFYTALKRLEGHKEFFERAWHAQIRATALFGPAAEEAFLQLDEARREVHVSAEMLMQTPEPELRSEENIQLWAQLKAGVWAPYGSRAKKGDIVGSALDNFRNGIEQICRPVIDDTFGKSSPKRWYLPSWFRRV